MALRSRVISTGSVKYGTEIQKRTLPWRKRFRNSMNEVGVEATSLNEICKGETKTKGNWRKTKN